MVQVVLPSVFLETVWFLQIVLMDRWIHFLKKCFEAFTYVIKKVFRLPPIHYLPWCFQPKLRQVLLRQLTLFSSKVNNMIRQTINTLLKINLINQKLFTHISIIKHNQRGHFILIKDARPLVKFIDYINRWERLVRLLEHSFLHEMMLHYVVEDD